METKETTFAGNLLINTRTINRTNELFKAITKAETPKTTITVSELSELLVLLESIATSSKLVYDLTVPERDIGKVQEAEGELEREIDNSNVFSGIRPQSDKAILALAKAGIQQSSALLRKRIESVLSNPADIAQAFPDVTPLKEYQIKDARDFAAQLTASLPPIHERDKVALDIIEQNKFMGAKCVAGILALEPEQDHLANLTGGIGIRDLARSVLADRIENDKELSWLVPMFINAFRSNYLNSLGAEHGNAAFFAGPDLEQVLDQQIFLLRNYVAGQLSEAKIRPEILKSALAERFRNTSQFPFLGLLILLGAEDGEPYSVFQASLDDKNILLAEFMAKKGGTQRYIHDFTSEELADFKAEKLDKVFRRMQRRVQIHGNADRINQNFIQPSIQWYPLIQPLINAALGHYDAEGEAPDMPGGSGEAVEYLINETLMPDQYLSYASYTHSIKRRLDLALKNRGDQDIITERVKEVLRCDLVPDPN